MTILTIAEAHALSVAAQERRAHLVRCVAMYEERGWKDLAAEYRVRLDEISHLFLEAQVASMQMHRCPADYLGGDGCTCEPRVAQVVSRELVSGR